MQPLSAGVLVAEHSPDRDLTIERTVLPAVPLRALATPPGHSPPAAAVIAALQQQPAPVLIIDTSQPYDRATLLTLARLGVHGIVCASVGYDHVDLAAANEVGITVCHVPDYCTDDVADHTLALLLWCLRKLWTNAPSAAGPDDFWSDRCVPLPRLSTCTLALLGFGRIGRAVARRAEAFGLRVRWYDPYVARGPATLRRTSRAESLTALVSGADALSIHCALTPQTRGLVDRAVLALLPTRAVVVNTARGAIIDECALLDAVQRQRLSAAALDVLEREPPGETPLFSAYRRGELPQVLISPHVAWYSEGSAVERRRKAAEEAGRLLRGDPPAHPLRPGP